MKPKTLMKMAFKVVKAQSPNILTAAGIGLGVLTVIFALDEVPKAKEIVKAKKEEGAKPVEIVKATAPVVKKTAAAGIGAMACVIMSNRISAERIATLSAAYNMSQTAAKAYQEKVKEIVGEEKEKEIRKEVAKNKFEEVLPEEIDKIEDLGGDIVFRDIDTGAMFITTDDALNSAVMTANYRMAAGETTLSLSELYDEIGIQHWRLADLVSFNINEGKINPEKIWVDPVEVTRNGQKIKMPCCEIDFFGYNRTQKRTGYGDLH